MDRIILLAKDPKKKRSAQEQRLVEQYLATLQRLEYQKKDLPAFMKYQGGGKKGLDDEDPKEKSKEEMNYLDADEDHLDGKDKLSEVIHMRNQQKIKFL